MSVSLLFPELLLLLVPLLFALSWRGRARGLGLVARVLIVCVLTLLAAVPLAPLGGRGADVVAVVDRSRSMPPGSRERALEIIRLLDEQRGEGDRVGIVTFGRDARIERLPEALGETTDFLQDVDSDGSDLGAAIGLAASLIPPERPGRIIVLSDGEANGSPAAVAAHDAAARGLPVDYRAIARPTVPDLAVESLELPGTLDVGEPFQFSARVRADRSVRAEVVLRRDGAEIAREVREFPAGPSQIVFRDVVDRSGLARYRLEIDASDRVGENNIGEGTVRVAGPAGLLLVNATGRPDNFSRALESGGLRVSIATPAALPRDAAALTSYRGVILENVPAGDVGPDALSALVRFATDLGGGVLVTGGRSSFGVGGYFKSELEPALPVSMEIRNEHRKLNLAMVVALDRSGSMAMPAGDGRTKMDLANLGACAAIETLGPGDEIGVIAVDSAAHVVVPLTSAEEKDEVCNQVRTIQSLGGGIFTYTALVQAATMVQDSDKGTRHIVLFADAADAEEPGEYVRLLERIRPLGMTVSVIGLGSEADPDAAFLKDIAERGGGRALFSADVDELPRLFAEEAITVARSSFVTEPTPTRTLGDMVLLGDLPRTPFPALDGYNLAYLRPGATMGVVTQDEYQAPVLAFWHRGLGRVAALTAEVDGRHSGSLNAWSSFPSFAVGLGRWLLGGDPPIGIMATMQREGGQGVVRVELDPSRARGGPDDVRAATAAVVGPGGRADETERLPMSWVSEDVLEARFPIQRAGAYVGAVQLASGAVLPLPPVSLPYSPEFEPRRDPDEGARLLAELAQTTGGTARTTWDDMFSGGGLRRRQIRDLVLPLALTLLTLHLIEVAGRRLWLFAAADERLRAMRVPRARLPAWPTWRRRRSAPGAPAPGSTPEPATSLGETVGVVTSSTAPTAQRTPGTPAARPIASALARAKAKARERMGE